MTELEALEARWAALDRLTKISDRVKIGGIQIAVKPDGSVNHAFQKGRPPISRTLPTAKEDVPGQPGKVRLRGEVVNRNGHQCREIAKGLYTDMRGRRIVDSTSAADRHAADAGYVRIRDE